MNEDIKEIERITFGVYSAEEIKKIAVCKVDSSKICSSDKIGSLGTVYDPRMGTLDNDKLCETCNLDIWHCSGHQGYIELNECIIHPLYYKEVINFLKSFCIKCYKLLMTRDQIYLNGFNKIKGPKRFTKILEKLEKIDICSHCSQPQPAIKYNVTDNSVSLVYKKKDNIKVSIGLSVDEIKKIFDNIVDDDVTLIGFDPVLIHPRNLILQVFPVIPPCCRPYVITDGNICDDDLTIQLIEIIKANNHLKVEEGTAVVCDTKRQKHIQSLKFRIATFYNNSSSKAKHTTSGRAIKGLKERLTGKNGLMRTNIMGKRCEQTARTVIGPDPTLKMGQLAVPPEIADNLTVPVQVTNYNYDMLTKLVNNGRANYVLKDNGNTRINLDNALFFRGTRLTHGDIIIRDEKEIVVNDGNTMLKRGDLLKRNGEIVKDIKYPEQRRYTLNIGDIVERKLQNGDIVLLNRQPTQN